MPDIDDIWDDDEDMRMHSWPQHRPLPDLRQEDEAIPEREMIAMRMLLQKMCENGCFMTEENQGYSFFIRGAGVTKGMGADGLINHLVKPHHLTGKETK